MVDEDAPRGDVKEAAPGEIAARGALGYDGAKGVLALEIELNKLAVPTFSKATVSSTLTSPAPSVPTATLCIPKLLG